MRAGLVLAVAGIVLAAVLGFAAHVVAQDTIGLPAVSLKGGRPLAPDEARPQKKKAKHTTTERETGPSGRSGASGPTTTRTQTVDDHGGGSNSGSGSSGSGSGSGDDSGGHGRNRGSDD